MADADRVGELIRRWTSLRSNRGTWDSHWDDLARVMLPRRYGFVSQTEPGARRTNDIFDGTPMQAARSLANAVSAMLRPEGSSWFTLRATEDDLNESDAAREWLSEATEEVRDALNNPKARFRQAVGEVDQDLVVFGTGIVFIGEAVDALMFQSIHLKDAVVFFSENGNFLSLYLSGIRLIDKGLVRISNAMRHRSQINSQ